MQIIAFAVAVFAHTKITRSSAVVDGPRDARCQLISCQLLHNCTQNLLWKGW